MIILFIGPSGSGKDTQAAMLEDQFGFTSISTGQLLRDELSSGSELGEEIKSYINKGKWAPDEIVYKMVENFISKHNSDNFILTGAIRRHSQISLLDNALKEIDQELNMVIHFELSEETAIERLSKRVIDPKTGNIYHKEFNPPPAGVEVIVREDDKPEAIKSRMNEFNSTFKPILEEYKNREILKTMDASKPIDEINKNIIDLINKFND